MRCNSGILSASIFFCLFCNCCIAFIAAVVCLPLKGKPTLLSQLWELDDMLAVAAAACLRRMQGPIASDLWASEFSLQVRV